MGVKTELPWIPELKPGWKQSRLKDIIRDMHSGGTPDSKVAEYYCDWEETDKGIPWCSIGDIPKGNHTLEKTYRRITDEGMKNKKLRKVPKGTLLYSIYASLGEVCITGMETTINQAILAIYENKEIIDQSYLYYYLLSLRENINYFANTNIQNNLNGEIVGNLIVVYPESLDEQRRIAKDLKKKDELIEKLLKDLIHKDEEINKYWQTLLKQTIVFGLKSGSKKTKTDVFWMPEMSESFNVKRLKQVLKSIKTGKTPSTKESSYFDGNIPWVGPGDVGAFRIRESEKTITQKAVEDGQPLFPKDSIMLVTIGSIGKTSILDCPMSCNQQVTNLIPDENQINLNFLYYMLLLVGPIMESVTMKITVAQMNNGNLGNFEIPLPELPEQMEIVKFLDKKYLLINELRSKIKAKIEALKNLKKATLIEELG